MRHLTNNFGPKMLARLINVVLLVTVGTLFFVSESRSVEFEEKYCKLYEKTVLNRDGEGGVDTVIYSLGCTTLLPGQKIVRIRIETISKDDFVELFATEIRPVEEIINPEK